MFGFGKPKAPAKPVVLLAGVPDPVSDPRPCDLSRLNFGCQRRSAGKKVARAVFDEGGVRGGKGTWWPFFVLLPHDTAWRGHVPAAVFIESLFGKMAWLLAAEGPRSNHPTQGTPLTLSPADARFPTHISGGRVSVGGNVSHLVAPAIIAPAYREETESMQV